MDDGIDHLARALDHGDNGEQDLAIGFAELLDNGGRLVGGARDDLIGFTQDGWLLSDSRFRQPDSNRSRPPSTTNLQLRSRIPLKELLAKQKYNTGHRPSQHHIGKTSFLQNNNGAIPSNVITLSNTHSNTDYQEYCRTHKLQPHPARMPSALAEFFIKFLTKPKMLVMDPFGGSNTTGAAAEKLGRRWVVIEPNAQYAEGSRGRFPNLIPAKEKDQCPRLTPRFQNPSKPH
jgi:hypothetical protein